MPNEFKDTRQKLTYWVATSSSKHALVLAKMMTKMKKPVLGEPAQPLRMYYAAKGSETKVWAVKGMVNIQVMYAIDCSKTMDFYKSKMCKHEAAIKSHEENNLNK